MRALLQVLATLFAVEQRRTSDPRNVLEVRGPHIGHSPAQPVFHLLPECQQLWLPTCAGYLQMLSSNTRRTKVVELSSGTHRSAACACLAVPAQTAASRQAHQGVVLPPAGAQQWLLGTRGSHGVPFRGDWLPHRTQRSGSAALLLRGPRGAE